MTNYLFAPRTPGQALRDVRLYLKHLPQCKDYRKSLNKATESRCTCGLDDLDRDIRNLLSSRQLRGEV